VRLTDWPQHWRDAVRLCRQADKHLSSWDRRSLQVLAGYQYQPSSRQLDIPHTITERVLAGSVP
jgi:hypothetical protein